MMEPIYENKPNVFYYPFRHNWEPRILVLTDKEGRECVNKKFLRKFSKLRNLCLRLQKDTTFWKNTSGRLDMIQKDIESMVAQSGPVMSQSLSDRVDRMYRELIQTNVAQMNFSIPFSHNLSKDSKAFLTQTVDTSIGSMRQISNETVNTIKEVFETFLTKMTTTFEQCAEAFNFTMSFMRFLALAYAIFFLISRATKFFGASFSTISTVLITLITMTVTDKLVKKFLVDYYSKHMENAKMLAQAGEEDSSFLSYVIPPLFLESVVDSKSNLFKRIWRSKDLDLIVKRLSYFGDSKIYNAFDNIGTWLTTMINKTVNYVKVTLLGHDPEEFLENQSDPLVDWEEQCRKHFVSDTDRIAIYTESTLADIKRLYNMGVSYMRHPLYKPHQRIISEILNQLLRFADKIKKKVGTDASVRNPPVTLYLYGETGVGKSTLTYPLCATLLKAIFTKEGNTVMLDSLKQHYKEMIYVRAAEQEFWDGYTQQLVTVFDDFNQQVDSSANPSLELFEIIRSSNIFPYPLHMASIEEKANTVFQSKVILCSSNNKTPKTESLNYPKALLRRFAKFVEVKRAPSENGTFSTDCYTFVQYDPFDHCNIVKSMSFNELIDEVVAMYFQEGEFVSSVDKFIMENVFAQGGSLSSDEGDNFVEASSSNDSDLDETLTREEKKEIVECINDQLKNENDTKTSLQLIRDYFHCAKESLQEKFLAYRQKYSFHEWFSFSKASKVVLGILSLVLVGYGIYSYVKGTPVKDSAESYEPKVASKAKVEGNDGAPEAYEPKVSRKVKVEGYNAREIKRRVEAYAPKVNRAVRVESNEVIVHPSSLIEKGDDIVQSEACSDINASEQLTAVTTNNTYVMTILSKESVIRVGHCIFLKGKIAVAPGHYLRILQRAYELDEGAILQFNHPYGKRNFFTFIGDIQFSLYKTKNISKTNDLDSRDLMHFVVDKSVVHRDISSYFCERLELQSVGSTRIQLPVMRWVRDVGYIFVKSGQGTSCIKNVSNVSYMTDTDPDAREIRLREAWEYSLETISGDCGAPLFVTNSKIGPGKIIGIHTAGGHRFGVGSCFATPFYMEDVKEILSRYDYKAQSCAFELVLRQDLEPCALPNHLDECEFILMGKVKDPPVQPSKSKISPSPLYGHITEPSSAPTWLYPRELDGQIFDPLKYRTARLGKDSVPIRSKLINLAKMALIDDIYSVYLQKKDLLDGRFPSSLTFDQAVLGIPGEDYVNSIKRDTSCGYPFVKEGWTRAKIFGNGDEYDMSTAGVQMLRDKVQECIDAARQGKILDHYFIDTLKDERKPKHKAHKSRMFSNGPIDYLVWSKMYFNPIVAVLSELKNVDHISVGSNVYSTDWDVIARYLRSKSHHMVAGDFEGFDASEQSDILYAAGDVLQELSKKIFNSTEDEILQQKAIIHSLVNSLHINENGIVLQWCKSLPSGHYLTAIINSVFVNLVMCLVFMEANQKYSFMTASSFFRECGIVAYGDDHVVSVPEKYLSVFNQQTLPVLMSKFGMFYTIETKDDTEIDFLSRKLEDVSYLKRNFVYDEPRQRYIAPLSLDVILEMPMWTKSSRDVVTNVFCNLEHALKELSLHDKDLWDKWSPILHSKSEEVLKMVSSLKIQDEVREIALGLSGYE
nr:MAG: nonstructural polyprotein [Black queen cell virus]